MSEGPRGVDSVWFGTGGSDREWVDSGWQDGLDSWFEIGGFATDQGLAVDRVCLEI